MKYVVHAALPLSVHGDGFESDIVRSSVKGTISLLRSVANVPSVKWIGTRSSETAVVAMTSRPTQQVRLMP